MDVLSGFDGFWRQYPRRVSKKDAKKAWHELAPSVALQQQIQDALSWQVEQPTWMRDGGAFVPYPATWLRAERWDDEPFSPVVGDPVAAAKAAELARWSAEIDAEDAARAVSIRRVLR